jgi:hypothetical protein
MSLDSASLGNASLDSGSLDSGERLATRLLESSVRRSYDPLVEIVWAAPLDDDRYWLAPKRSSLYGTPLWDGLNHRQRVELTKHEVASAAGAGIWFETILMQMLIRQYYQQDPTSRDAQYALTEVADECRHSVMFGRLIERLGTPVYRPGRVENQLGRLLKTTAHGPEMYATTLVVEEVLDRFQREIAADESLQPLIRMVSRVHVVEEARHVRYARAALERWVGTSGPVGLAVTRLSLGRTAMAVASCLVHPRVYAVVGIDPAAGRAAARGNPHWRATLRWSAEKVVAAFDDLGLIKGPGAVLWRRSGLI